MHDFDWTMDSVGAGMAIRTRTWTLSLGRTVYDKTGLTGLFDVMHLEYANEDIPDGEAPLLSTALRVRSNIWRSTASRALRRAGRGPASHCRGQ